LPLAAATSLTIQDKSTASAQIIAGIQSNTT